MQDGSQNQAHRHNYRQPAVQRVAAGEKFAAERF